VRESNEPALTHAVLTESGETNQPTLCTLFPTKNMKQS